MAYKKNEKKLLEYLKKKNDFNTTHRPVKNISTKPSNDKNIRRG